MSKKKTGLSGLLNKTLGLDTDTQDSSTEELLNIVNTKETTNEVSNKMTDSIDQTIEVINSKIEDKKIETHDAYNVVYDKATKKYILITVSYTDAGNCQIKSEAFADVLPEVHFKMGKIFLDKLKDSLYNR